MRDKRIDDKMEVLLEQQAMLETGIANFKSKIKQDDHFKQWYEKSINTYQLKLDKVIKDMKEVGGYREPSKGTETKAEVDSRRESPSSVKEEATKTQDLKTSKRS